MTLTRQLSYVIGSNACNVAVLNFIWQILTTITADKQTFVALRQANSFKSIQPLS